MLRDALLTLLGIGALFAQTPSYTISTIAGANPSGDFGKARDARLFYPQGIAIDTDGTLYICDRGNGRVRRVSPDQTITTIAGGGDSGPADGRAATSVFLYRPAGIALDSVGKNLYFSDSTRSQVYSINLTTGIMSIIAGDGSYGDRGDGGSAKAAKLDEPAGLALDPTLGLLIADVANHRIRRVDLTTGVITTFAGSRGAGFAGDGGPAIAAKLNNPFGVAVGAGRNVYIADTSNGRVRRVNAEGVISTLVGNPTATDEEGPGDKIRIHPLHIAVGPDGSLYVTDDVACRIRRVFENGAVGTFAGTNYYGFGEDGVHGRSTMLDHPTATTLDAAGALYIADSSSHRIRRMATGNGIVQTVVGRNRYDADSVAANTAWLTAPEGLAYDAAGNLYIADTGNHCIRRVGRDGVMTTVAGIGGYAAREEEGALATKSNFVEPSAVVVDADGSLYIADRGNQIIRHVNPAGIVRMISGKYLYVVEAMAIHPQRRLLYFTDSRYHQVLSLDLNQLSAPPVVVAGSPESKPGFSGDGQAADKALLNAPKGIAIAPNGDIYFVDAGNSRLRRIDGSGIITTIAGNGDYENYPTDGPLANAVLSFPSHVTIDAQGAIYVTEPTSARIRRISGSTIATVGGSPALQRGFAGDGGPALQAKLYDPTGLATAPDGSIVFTDLLNHRVRRLTPNAPPVTATKLEIVSGNNQRGPVNEQLPLPLAVRLLNISGQPVAGSVSFAVTSGTAFFPNQATQTSVNAGADGFARLALTIGPAAGPVTVTVRSGFLDPVVFSLTATAAASGIRPVIAPGGVIGVGTSVPAVTSIAPRGIVSIFGKDFLAPGVGGRRVNFTTESINGALPTRFLDVCVEIGDVRAPILDAFDSQLNVVVPAIAAGHTPVRVIRRCDQPDATTSVAETVTVATVAPEFLYSQLNADGRNPVAAVNAITNALIGPRSLSGFIPAKAGDIVTIYGSGFGATNPAITIGGTSTGIAPVTAAVRVRIGTVELARADILYAGASPDSLIYQVNLRLPAELSSGNLPIILFLNDVASPPNAFLAIE